MNLLTGRYGDGASLSAGWNVPVLVPDADADEYSEQSVPDVLPVPGQELDLRTGTS